MRLIAVAFNAYVSGKLGAEGMGLYSLVVSVYGFAVTLATSGISLAVMRLVSEEMGKGKPEGAILAMKKCVGYALIFGFLSFLLLFFGADAIAKRILQDSRTYLSLRVLSVALPFIALSNVFSGYFNAVRRVIKSASASIAEQFLKIMLTVGFLRMLLPKGIEYATLALVLGTAISEAVSFFYLFLFYIFDKRKYLKTKSASKETNMKKRMLHISLPIALSSYLRSGLVTVQHILIPIGLRKHGADYSTSLASYGVIHGMVFPLILFPSAVCMTFAGLIVPELSELAARYQTIKAHRHICYIVKRALSFALLFGIGTAGIFICFAEPLGILIYQSREAARYIRLFAALVPVMYLDTTVDGMLKGLGQQVHSMFYNIVDASLSVFLVWTLMPKIGIYGYVRHGADQSCLQFIAPSERHERASADFKDGIFTDSLYRGRHGGFDADLKKHRHCAWKSFFEHRGNFADVDFLFYIFTYDRRTFRGRKSLVFRYFQKRRSLRIRLIVLYHIQTARSRETDAKNILKKRSFYVILI